MEVNLKKSPWIKIVIILLILNVVTIGGVLGLKLFYPWYQDKQYIDEITPLISDLENLLEEEQGVEESRRQDNIEKALNGSNQLVYSCNALKLQVQDLTPKSEQARELNELITDMTVKLANLCEIINKSCVAELEYERVLDAYNTVTTKWSGPSYVTTVGGTYIDYSHNPDGRGLPWKVRGASKEQVDKAYADLENAGAEYEQLLSEVFHAQAELESLMEDKPPRNLLEYIKKQISLSKLKLFRRSELNWTDQQLIDFAKKANGALLIAICNHSPDYLKQLGLMPKKITAYSDLEEIMSPYWEKGAIKRIWEACSPSLEIGSDFGLYTERTYMLHEFKDSEIMVIRKGIKAKVFAGSEKINQLGDPMRAQINLVLTRDGWKAR